MSPDGYWTHGYDVGAAAVEGMFSPARCAYCQGVYDLGMVDVIARYADCSVWKSPCCGITVDDRGETGWKSKRDYYPLDRDGREIRRGAR